MITIVAVVAIVGLVTLFLNSGQQTTLVETPLLDDGNLAGEAFYMKGDKGTSQPLGAYVPAPTEDSETDAEREPLAARNLAGMAVSLASCRDGDAWAGYVDNQAAEPSNVTLRDNMGKQSRLRDACYSATHVNEGTCSGSTYRGERRLCVRGCATVTLGGERYGHCRK